MSGLESQWLHPAVANWFGRTFERATPAQLQAWPAILAGQNVLVAAPTGSGKTLAAFLIAIDGLVRRGIAEPLPDETLVLYISPLKALSNDIQRNLEGPLAGIRAELLAQGLPDVAIRTLVRTGDTPQSERAGMRRKPPHIVVTTPESLYVLLGSESGRKMLATTRTVIVDEIHAVASNKRGSHLALSLERLHAVATQPLVRIGLSATQKPIEEIGRFLVGAEWATRGCTIIDTGHVRERDLALEVPPSPLEAVMSGEVWKQVYARLAELINQHRTTLIFVNTRRMAERVARNLSDLIGPENITSHHGSMAKEQRFNAEQRLKAGKLKALVATASLELGIDIGDVNLVCQLASPRSIATFLQRAGRAGHSIDGIPKARFFPLSRDELVDAASLLDAVRRGELDRLSVPAKPLDVLAQQIVAEVAAQEWSEEALYQLCIKAYPYATLTRQEYTEVVAMLGQGFSTARGQRAAYIHRDAVNGMLRSRRGARITALTSGGTIPDTADYDVVLEPAGQLVGTVNEDFAIESLAGDIFQLGNMSYRIMRVEAGRVRVEDARGQPPTIPFWLGEAPARSNELSFAVSRLREEISARVDDGSALGWLTSEIGLGQPASEQLVDYLKIAKVALGVLPTQTTVVLERFFDESGGMQLIIHSPYGSRINRAWGLALRKRFCRKFNFELQAAATEDAIILSLSTAHSFPLEEVVRYLNSKSVRGLLVQAMLDAPMFAARWRWSATTALALPRFRGGKKTPPQLQRMAAEDLIASVFPDQIACPENLAGEREIPDHPLVNQVVHDCLHEAMDIDGLESLLGAIERGQVQVVARDLTEPSPLAAEILGARPYAFLDDAPLEERRARAVMSRRWLDADTAGDLGKLDADAISRVREEAWPDASNADELHDALLWLGFLTQSEVDQHSAWEPMLQALAQSNRATRASLPNVPADRGIWVAAERLPQFQSVFTDLLRFTPEVVAPGEFASRVWTRDDALLEIVRGRLDGMGPTTAQDIADSLGLAAAEIDTVLIRLEVEGVVMRGSFTPVANGVEWCERRLLARVHRYTVKRLRQEIEPASTQDFMRFLFRWQHLVPGEKREGPDSLAKLVEQLEGFEAAAAAWESEILPARLDNYDFTWLDELCLSGRAVWMRVTSPEPAVNETSRNAAPIRSTPITLLPRRSAAFWMKMAGKPEGPMPSLGSRAQIVADYCTTHGASFFDEIVSGTGLLRSEVEDALAELVARGFATSDSFAGLRALLTPSDRRKPLDGGRRHRRTSVFGIEEAGRWSLLRRVPRADAPDPYSAHDEIAEHVVHTLLRRYGIVFWRLLERESASLPPWRDLLRVLRRMEARGDIRGGRFIAGMPGEHFALPEAVDLMRETRKTPPSQICICISATDPLNLLGYVGPGSRVAGLTQNRLLYRDGLPIAVLAGNEIEWLVELGQQEQRIYENMLVRRQSNSPLLAYLR